MARVSKDGSFSGRLGDLVYYKKNGKNFVRKFTQPNDPETPEQMVQRAKLSAVNQFLTYFKDVVRIGFQTGSSGNKPYYEALKYHMQTEFRDITPPDQDPGDKIRVFEIVVENAKLARGHLSPPEVLSCIRTSDTISLRWDIGLGEPPNRHTDLIAMVAWLPGKKAATQFNTGARSAGSGQMKLPVGFTPQVHLWVFYWNGEKGSKVGEENVSESVYLGVI